MSIQDYLRIFREQWAIILTAVLVALIAAGSVWYLRPSTFTAKLTMYVSAQAADTTQMAYQGSLLSQQRVMSYVQLVSSTRVAEQVVGRLGLAETAEELADRIEASTPLDSVLIDVAVTGSSPEEVTAVANTVGTVFTGLVDELEKPTNPSAVPSVAVRVVQPAAVPTEPSSTGLPTTLALGLLAGLMIGIGGALGRNALDTSVRSPDDLREVANVPLLGTVAFDIDVPKRPLTVHEDPHSVRSEAFRQLRTNLQFVDVDNPRKVIVMTSSMPQEGKTTTLCNLAIAMSSTGSRVLVIEGDLRHPKLADLLGLERAVGLTSVLAGKVRLEDAIQHWTGGALDVLASGPLPPNPSELLGSKHMADMLARLRDLYDVVLIDSPPLLPVTDAAAVASATDGVILVCRFGQTRRDQVRAAMDALKAVSAPLLGTVFTMVPSSGPRAYAYYNGYYGSQQPAAPAPHVNGVQPSLSAPTLPEPGIPRLDADMTISSAVASNNFGRPQRPSPVEEAN